jgi:glycosyltransferase involved in cell wall biosynthesis
MGVDGASSTAPLRRVLVVSRYYASDFSARVGGVWQRLRMLLEAAAKSADALEILFFIDPGMMDGTRPEVAESSLREHWNIDASVSLAPRAEKRMGPLMQVLRGSIDFRCQEDYFRFNGPAQRDAIGARIERDIELIVAHRLALGAAATGPVTRAVPVVMDLDDIEHRSLARQLRRPPHTFDRWLRWLELPALKRGELGTIRATRTSLVCSDLDHAYLVTQGISNTTVIPNVIRFAPPAPIDPNADTTLFFIGAYGYPPNLDAAEFLVRMIFPLVLRKVPEARLVLVGDSIEKLPSRALRPTNVDFVGFVPDLAEAYRRATVVCCPILAGGGTRIKIIEAAAAGKAVVSTTIGAEGLDFESETEILRRDTPASFADACVALLQDPVRNRSMGAAAFAKARRLYDRDRTVDRLVDVFVAAASRR